MRKLIIFAIICCLLVSCSNPSKNETDYNFAIFLLKNDTLDYRDVEKIALDEIELMHNPMISTPDIACYDTANECFYMDSFRNMTGLSRRIELLGPAGDVPFVLMLNDERYFLGSHVGVACSHMFAGPRLDYYSDSTEGVSVFSITFSEEDKYLKEAPKYQAILNKFSK
jgi:hypothetical protein